MSEVYTPSEARIAYENSHLFWQDWDREEQIKAALKVATPEEVAILNAALAPITERQEAYWSERQRAAGYHYAETQERIVAFSKKFKEEQADNGPLAKRDTTK